MKKHLLLYITKKHRAATGKERADCPLFLITYIVNNKYREKYVA